MKKVLLLAAVFILVAKPSFTQVGDRFSYLSQDEIEKYAVPLATSLGTVMNSATYHSADVSSLFGFSIGLKGMFIFIPESQQNFKPNLPNGYNADNETATIYGDKGGYYAGPNGYRVYPPGMKVSTLAMGLPQISASFMGTEVLLRGLPTITVSDVSVGFFGIGVKHNISQYIPTIPVDLAVQILYSSFSVDGGDNSSLSASNFAINAEVSKGFGIFTAYGGLQYENSTMDTKYDYKDPNAPTGTPSVPVDVSLTGDNNFRFTVGGALNLAFLVLNADFSITAQPILTTGVTFAF